MARPRKTYVSTVANLIVPNPLLEVVDRLAAAEVRTRANMMLALVNEALRARGVTIDLPVAAELDGGRP
jgi:hypothetical protein